MKNPKSSNGWKAGQSGNPAGRKPGTGAVAKIRASMAEHVPALVAVLLERTVAPLKAAEQVAPLALPDGTLTEQGRAVIAAVASGELAPSQGAALLSSLGTLAKLTEADELARRIDALEALSASERATA